AGTQPGLYTTVSRRPGSEDHVVQQDGHAGEGSTGQVHIEMTEIADQDGVHLAAHRPATAPQSPPASDQPGCQHGQPPRLTQQPDPIRRAQTQWLVDLADIEAMSG